MAVIFYFFEILILILKTLNKKLNHTIYCQNRKNQLNSTARLSPSIRDSINHKSGIKAKPINEVIDIQTHTHTHTYAHILP